MQNYEFQMKKLFPLKDTPEKLGYKEFDDVMYLNKEEREIYEGMLKWQRDYVSKLLSAESKGVEKGREEGRKEGKKE